MLGARIAVISLFLGVTIGADFDLLIRDARVVDGTGSPWFRADIGIRGDLIVALGALAGKTADQIVDAEGLVLSSGFVDVHTHVEGSGRGIERIPDAQNFLRDGVTSIVTGNCGGSVIEVGDWFSQLERLGLSINLATLIGHNTVRSAVMGRANRAATSAELEEMQALIAKALEDGAVGFSTVCSTFPGPMPIRPK